MSIASLSDKARPFYVTQAEIDATHPMNDGVSCYAEDEAALMLVGERHGKRELVDLVRTLLIRSRIPTVSLATPLDGKYANVLHPFLVMMEGELHANATKGDRPGWLAMDRKTALLEIYYHVAKLQKSVKDDSPHGIRENAADVANMAMMLVDVCGLLPVAQEVQ